MTGRDGRDNKRKRLSLKREKKDNLEETMGSGSEWKGSYWIKILESLQCGKNNFVARGKVCST